MNYHENEDRELCVAFREDLTELALGILSGRRRSEVLNHVESCSWCSAELEQLVIVSDTVLQLAPQVEPPLGFETRLAQRLQVSGGVRPKQLLHRTGVLTAAAVLMIALGIGIGVIVSSQSNPSRNGSITASLTSAKLSSHGQDFGEVSISEGDPAWMYMTIDRGRWTGLVTCQVTLVDGKVETIGKFKLTSGYVAWGAPLKSSASQVRSVQIVATNGVILASAAFST